MPQPFPFSLPRPVSDALNALGARGYPAYVVGGCVRDMLRGVAPHDYDIATAATPAQTRLCFPGSRVADTGARHGTVTVVMAGMPLEITTFRTDGAYLDGRHPDSVTFSTRIADDLARRDFTINAMAWRPGEAVLDPFGGQRDCQSGVIRCVGDAGERFGEDALRMLRAMRFASELGFAIAPDTARAMNDCRGKLSLVSRERVAAECVRMINGADAARVLRGHADVFFAAVPALSGMRGCAQVCPYHVHDVWEHALHTLDCTPPGDAVLRMAALLHDCGKPAVHVRGEDGRDHFPGHQKAGEEAARAILRDLRLPTAFIADVAQLTLLHDAHIPVPETALWLSRLGQKQFERLLALKRADILAHAPQVAEKAWKIDRLYAEEARVLAAGYPLKLGQLAVNGDDLAAIGIPRGAIMGETLARLHAWTLTDRLPNEKAALLDAAKAYAVNIR